MLKASYTQPYLIDPMEIHRNIYSDLGAEIQGQKNAAALQRLATTQAGTDFDRNAAMALDAKLKGIELKDLKFKASNDLERQTAEASWAQEKENKQNRWQTANSNKQAIYENDMANLQRKLATKHRISRFGILIVSSQSKKQLRIGKLTVLEWMLWLKMILLMLLDIILVVIFLTYLHKMYSYGMMYRVVKNLLVP